MSTPIIAHYCHAAKRVIPARGVLSGGKIIIGKEIRIISRNNNNLENKKEHSLTSSRDRKEIIIIIIIIHGVSKR
jgi:hypothetical protein